MAKVAAALMQCHTWYSMRRTIFLLEGQEGAELGEGTFTQSPFLSGDRPLWHETVVGLIIPRTTLILFDPEAGILGPNYSESFRDGSKSENLEAYCEKLRDDRQRQAKVASADLVKGIVGANVELTLDDVPLRGLIPEKTYAAVLGDSDPNPYYFFGLPTYDQCLGLIDPEGTLAIFGLGALRAAMLPETQIREVTYRRPLAPPQT